MVYSGSDVSAMFDAADANNGDLTKDIWEAYGGPERATLKQCRRRYKSTKAKAAAQDEDEGCEEDEETQTPAKKGKGLGRSLVPDRLNHAVADARHTPPSGGQVVV